MSDFEWDDTHEPGELFAHTASCPQCTHGLSPWCNTTEADEAGTTSMWVLSAVFDDDQHQRLTRMWKRYIEFRSLSFPDR